MIGESYRTNFETLRTAAANQDLCLLEVYDRLTGEAKVALCAGYTDEEEVTHLIPLAMMFDCDPYTKYVNEPEMVAKYKGVGQSIVRLSDQGFLDTIQAVPFMDEEPARAYALLKDHLDDHDRARALTPQFTEEILSKTSEEWSLSAPEIDSWIHHAEHPEEEADGQQTAEAPEPGKTP